MIADISAERRTKMNEETISGIVADLKVIPTRTGTSMVTFVIGAKCCKAFGDIAAALQTLNEEQVQITAKRGTYRRKPEYTVVSVKGTVDGRPVTVTDTRSNAPVRAASGTCPLCGAQMASRDFYPGLTAEGFPEKLRDQFGGSVIPEVPEPTKKPVPETRTLSEEERQKVHETMTASWVKSFSDIFLHPDSDLEKISTSSRVAAWTREAARRVLETRKARRVPAHDSDHVEGVTSEDLENQYNAQKAVRELEKLNQAGSQGIEGGQAP
jgi:hypothetical protein